MPLTVARPLKSSVSVVWPGPMSIEMVPPATATSSVVPERVLLAAPFCSVSAPASTVSAPTEPVPSSARVPPELTATADEARLPVPLSSSVPALTVVAPVIVLPAVRFTVPEPFLVSVPPPEITPAWVKLPVRLKMSAPLLTMAPARLPVAPPLPICSVVAAAMVVSPE